MPSVMEQTVLSDRIIPAARGEFYFYSSEFSLERPVFVLMKCKANKNRPVEQLPNLKSEANVLFQFGNPFQATAYSIKSAHSFDLLDYAVKKEDFGETWLALSKVTAEKFEDICSRKDTATLIRECEEACSKRNEVVELSENSIVAMMTDSGKYGMFLVQDISATTIQIISCHILS